MTGDRSMTSSPPPDDPLQNWVQESSRRALGYALTLVPHQQDAEDIVHDCYRRLLAKADHYDLPNDGMKLLFRSITNACINQTQRRKPEFSLGQLEETSGADRQSLEDRKTPQPADNAMREELQSEIAQALEQLPLPQRAAIELRGLGHSLVEVADILEVSHANARVLLHRARAALAVRLRHWIEED